MEIWKPITCYEGRYEISNHGRVRSFVTNRGYIRKRPLILRVKIDKYGYETIGLSKNGVKKFITIHRLVGNAFIPNPYNLPQINHKDEDKRNNNVDNLEWCTGKYNCNYGSHREKISKSKTNSPKISYIVLQYDLAGNLIKEYPSANEAMRQLGVGAGNISKCCNGVISQSGGYIWKWKKRI